MCLCVRKSFLRKRYLIFIGLCLLASCSVYAQKKIKAPGSNFSHRPGIVLVGENDSLKAEVYGSGEAQVILIPSHTQGTNFYQSFIERNTDKATFHVIIPPGMDGTAAYPWPQPADDFESQPWTSRFKNELAAYIQTNFEEKPFLLTPWYLGVNAVVQLLDDHPDILKGVLFVSRSPYYRWYSSENADSTKQYDVQAQRKRLTSFIKFWEQVDENTWNANTFKGSFYTKDDSLSTMLKLNEARQPMVIEIRYFIEYMVNDLGPMIEKIEIPVHIMSNLLSRKGLNSLLYEANVDALGSASLQNPRYGSSKDWPLSRKDNFSFTEFDNLGLMIWHDMPEKFDEDFLAFINRVNNEK